jgi:hypothetical protein
MVPHHIGGKHERDSRSRIFYMIRAECIAGGKRQASVELYGSDGIAPSGRRLSRLGSKRVLRETYFAAPAPTVATAPSW